MTDLKNYYGKFDFFERDAKSQWIKVGTVELENNAVHLIDDPKGILDRLVGNEDIQQAVRVMQAINRNQYGKFVKVS